MDELRVRRVFSRKCNRSSVAVHSNEPSVRCLEQPAQPYASAATNVEDVARAESLVDKMSVAKLSLRRGTGQPGIMASSSELDLDCRARIEMRDELTPLSAPNVGWVRLFDGPQRTAGPPATHG